MSALDGSSDIEDESQATQLLQSMLNPGTVSPNVNDIRPEDEFNMSKETTDSLTSRHSSSLPSFNFHGLAQTQTQQLDDEVEVSGGSQKENIGTHNLPGEESRLSDFAPLNYSRARDGPSAFPSAVATKPKSIGVKAVSFQSPRGKYTSPQTFHNPARRKPTRPAAHPFASYAKRAASPASSQDSFGVVDPDPEEQFLATSKQFNVPLSELPRVVLPGARESVSGGHSPKSMYSSSHFRRSSPIGNVLVESTPSASGGSQSQVSQPLMETQLDSQPDPAGHQPDDMEGDVLMDTGGDLSRYSTDDCLSDAPSSNFYNPYEDREEDSLPTPAMEATQPSTQIEEDNNMDVEPSHPFDLPIPTSSVHPFDALIPTSNVRGGTARSTSTVKSRHLLSLVDPKKRYRYEQHLNRVADKSLGQDDIPGLSMAKRNMELVDRMPSEPKSAMPPEGRFPITSKPLPSPATQVGGSSTRPNWEETQPSFEAEIAAPVQRHFLGRSPAPAIENSTRVILEETQPSFEGKIPAQRRLPGRSGPGNAPIPKPYDNASPRRGQAADDRMEIIPDSEPLQDTVTPEASDFAGQSPNRSSHQPSSVRNEITTTTLSSGTSTMEVGNNLFPDDEEDIPLAIAVSTKGRAKAVYSVTSKGKGKASNNSNDPSKSSNFRKGKQYTRQQNMLDSFAKPTGSIVLETSMPSARTTRTSISFPEKRPPATARSWEAGEVPSSHPEQDLKVAESIRPQATKVEKKSQGVGTSSKPKRSTAPVTKPRRRAVSSLASEDGLVIQPSDGDDDGTEPADEEYMDTGPASRKRKRNGPPAKATKAPSKGGKKTKKPPTPTPTITRQGKRLRSVASVGHTIDWTPIRVFALWKQDGHFYPGTIQSRTEAALYNVHFDDQTDGIVNLDQMRLLDLHVGDDVLLPKLTRGVKVVDVSKLESNDIVSVRLDTGITEIQLQAIKIASKTITYAWKDRALTHEAIMPVVKPERGKPSPTPSRLSMVSGHSTRGLQNNIFVKTALAVTISSNGNWEKEKENVMSSIKHSGGIMINDWADVIRMEGKHSQSNNRWVIHKSEVKWVGKDDVERVFLVADDSSLKPKFLIALALGIPCLCTSWLYESADAGVEKDWSAYTLPQGYSDVLGARASQQLDVDWGNSVHQLDAIMDNKVPCKLFSGQSILCVGSELVPVPKGKKLTGSEERTQEARNAVTRIILAMGADCVEAVTDIKHVSGSVSSYDYVVIKELAHYGSHLEDGNVVHWAWVKDCLIASRLLPLPEWRLPMSESQDA